MGLQDWYRYHAGQGWRDMSYHLYLGTWRRIGKRIHYGTPIWEPWDVMLVLDACRYDMMTEIAGEYGFIGEVEDRYSVGSESAEWMETNFDPNKYGDELAETAYVTANAKTDRLDPSWFARLDEVWQYAWDESWNTTRAESVTDRAIDIHRSLAPERLLVHYSQPHLPIVPPAREDDVPENLLDVDWEAIRRDPEITRPVLWETSVQNLRYVLGSVKRLLENIDAETVIITADHGNLFGEWRGAKLYGHPPDVPVPLLKRVPWVTTEAENIAGYEPTLEAGEETGNVEEKLTALGYR